MTSVLSPHDVGVWGAPLRSGGAVGIIRRSDAESYNRNSIGQRGGGVITPIASMDTRDGFRSSSASDPFNKQTAALVIQDEPRPTTLRDGFAGGADSFMRGAIVTPIARTTLTEDEIKKRLATEATREKPASAQPMSLDSAIALLKSVEETWPDGKDEAGYNDLVADAQRLKILKGATLRRVLKNEEQEFVNDIANKYAGIINADSTEMAAAQREVIAEEARPAAEVASAEVAARFAERNRDIAAANAAQLDASRVDVLQNMDDLAGQLRQARHTELLLQELNARAYRLRMPRDVKDAIVASQRRATDKVRQLGRLRQVQHRMQRDLARKANAAMEAADAYEQEMGAADEFVPDESRADILRADITDKYAPHQRGERRQASAIYDRLGPEFVAGRRQADAIAGAQFELTRRWGQSAKDQRRAMLAEARLNAADAAAGVRDQIGATQQGINILSADNRTAAVQRQAIADFAREDSAAIRDLSREQLGLTQQGINLTEQLGRDAADQRLQLLRTTQEGINAAGLLGVTAEAQRRQLLGTAQEGVNLMQQNIDETKINRAAIADLAADLGVGRREVKAAFQSVSDALVAQGISTREAINLATALIRENTDDLPSSVDLLNVSDDIVEKIQAMTNAQRDQMIARADLLGEQLVEQQEGIGQLEQKVAPLSVIPGQLADLRTGIEGLGVGIGQLATSFTGGEPMRLQHFNPQHPGRIGLVAGPDYGADLAASGVFIRLPPGGNGDLADARRG